MSDEDEWIEEETLVVAELSGLIDTETLKKANLKCHILGIDSEKPVLQVDNYLFSGHYEDTIGTDLIFKAKYSDASKTDTEVKSVDYQCMSTKTLVMQRTFVQNKNISEGMVNSDTLSDDTMEEEGQAVGEEEEEGENTSQAAPVASTSGAQIVHAQKSRTLQPFRSEPSKSVPETSQPSTEVSSTSVDRPGDASTSVDRPGDAATSVDRPGEASSSVDRPQEASTSVDRPQETSTSVDRPGETTAAVASIDSSSKGTSSEDTAPDT